MVCPASLMKDWAGDQNVGLLTAAPARLAGFAIKRTSRLCTADCLVCGLD